MTIVGVTHYTLDQRRMETTLYRLGDYYYLKTIATLLLTTMNNQLTPGLFGTVRAINVTVKQDWTAHFIS